MQHLYTTFFTLLRSALTASDAPGDTPGIPDTLASTDWHALYDLSRQQALTGVIYHAVSHLQPPCPSPCSG